MVPGRRSLSKLGLFVNGDDCVVVVEREAPPLFVEDRNGPLVEGIDRL